MHLVVTAGPTREAIDPVRFLSNRSSGKMGHALAQAGLDLGCDVTLITSVAVAEPLASRSRVVSVESSDEMYAAVTGALIPGTILIMAAAVADYKPSAVAANKIKKRDPTMTLELVKTIDILASTALLTNRQSLFVVGFAAETDDPVANAVRKLKQKQLDLIVVNDISEPGIGMGSDDNAVTVLDSSGVVMDLPLAPKAEIALALVGLALERHRLV